MEPDGRLTRSGARVKRSEEARSYALDVLVEGGPVRREVPVRLEDGSLRVGDERLELSSVYWVSRRAGLVLVFARERTVALLGKSGDLEEVARGVERGSDRAAQRLLLQPLAREVVVCTAGTAVRGSVGETRVSGLHLAVFTQRGLHLIARDRRHSVAWPVGAVRELPTAAGETGRGGVEIEGDGFSLSVRYLFPEEIQAVARVATSPPREEEAPGGAIEMFARGEVTPPLAPRLPEFAISVRTLREACETSAARVRVEPRLADRFGARFFERHFRELGEMALGPLMLRKSAAAVATRLSRAVEAMDPERLREDARAALGAAVERLFEVYEAEVERLASERGPAELAARFQIPPADRHEVRGSVRALMEELEPCFTRVLARQHLLLQRLHAREHAPPDAEDEQVEEAASEWRSEILELDRAYGAAWTALLDAIADLWSGTLLPQLAELAALPTRRWRGPPRAALWAGAAVAGVVALVWLLT